MASHHPTDPHSTDHAPVSNNVLLAAYLIFVAILWIFGDALTAIVGMLLIGAVFVSQYKSQSSHDGHH